MDQIGGLIAVIGVGAFFILPITLISRAARRDLELIEHLQTIEPPPPTSVSERLGKFHGPQGPGLARADRRPHSEARKASKRGAAGPAGVGGAAGQRRKAIPLGHAGFRPRGNPPGWWAS